MLKAWDGSWSSCLPAPRGQSHSGRWPTSSALWLVSSHFPAEVSSINQLVRLTGDAPLQPPTSHNADIVLHQRPRLDPSTGSTAMAWAQDSHSALHGLLAVPPPAPPEPC